MRFSLCVCAFFPQKLLRTSLLVLIHQREYWKPSNTGHLVRLISPEAKVVVWRHPVAPDKSLFLLEKDKEPLVLFPSEEAEDLASYCRRRKKEIRKGNGKEAGKLEKDIQLIVPDGSWRQARKIITRDKHLKDLPRVKLGNFPPSIYQLRQEKREGGMATFEAIARALGILESKALQEKMEKAFSHLVERILWTRGKERFPLGKNTLEQNPGELTKKI